MENAENELLTLNPNRKDFFNILNHIKSLKFADRPNYDLIRNILQNLLNFEILIHSFSQEKTIASTLYSSSNTSNFGGNHNNSFQCFDNLNFLEKNNNYFCLNNNNSENNFSSLNFKNDFDLIYPIYLLELYKQVNQMTTELFIKFTQNKIENDQKNNLLNRKRERSPEVEEENKLKDLFRNSAQNNFNFSNNTTNFFQNSVLQTNYSNNVSATNTNLNGLMYSLNLVNLLNNKAVDTNMNHALLSLLLSQNNQSDSCYSPTPNHNLLVPDFTRPLFQKLKE